MRIVLVGFGAGGHARVVIEALQTMRGIEVAGLYDNNPSLTGTAIAGIPVLGTDVDSVHSLNSGIRHAFIGVGSTEGGTVRRELFRRIVAQGFEIAAVAHATAFISPSVTLGVGPTILAGAIINAGAILGDNVIVNTGAIIEHDCRIDSHVHVATGAHLAGSVIVDEGAHIGVGAVIRQNIHIGRMATVGAGAVVVKDVPDYAVVVGNPARVLRVMESHA